MLRGRNIPQAEHRKNQLPGRDSVDSLSGHEQKPIWRSADKLCVVHTAHPVGCPVFPTRLAGVSPRAPDQRGGRPPLLDTPPSERPSHRMSDRQGAQAKKKTRSGSETRKRQPRIIFRVSQGERAEIKANAAAAGFSIGSFIRSVTT